MQKNQLFSPLYDFSLEFPNIQIIKMVYAIKLWIIIIQEKSQEAKTIKENYLLVHLLSGNVKSPLVHLKSHDISERCMDKEVTH